MREPPKIMPLRGEVVRAAACGGPPDERMRIAGLRGAEAAARAVLWTAFSVFGVLFADGGRSAIAVRRKGAAANCATLRVASSKLFFLRYLLFGQKVTEKPPR